MAKFYANMIVKGTRTYEQAPDTLKEAVKAALIEMNAWPTA